MLLAQRLQLSEGQHKPSAQASGQKHFMSGKTNRAHTEPDRITTGAHVLKLRKPKLLTSMQGGKELVQPQGKKEAAFHTLTTCTRARRATDADKFSTQLLLPETAQLSRTPGPFHTLKAFFCLANEIQISQVFIYTHYALAVL